MLPVADQKISTSSWRLLIRFPCKQVSLRRVNLHGLWQDHCRILTGLQSKVDRPTIVQEVCSDDKTMCWTHQQRYRATLQWLTEATDYNSHWCRSPLLLLLLWAGMKMLGFLPLSSTHNIGNIATNSVSVLLLVAKIIEILSVQFFLLKPNMHIRWM